MGSKSGEFKEVKWSINSLKSQIDSVNNCEADTDDAKDPDSSDKEGDHGKRQRSEKVNPALTRKRGANERQNNLPRFIMTRCSV